MRTIQNFLFKWRFSLEYELNCSFRLGQWVLTYCRIEQSFVFIIKARKSAINYLVFFVDSFLNIYHFQIYGQPFGFRFEKCCSRKQYLIIHLIYNFRMINQKHFVERIAFYLHRAIQWNSLVLNSIFGLQIFLSYLLCCMLANFKCATVLLI